MIARASLTLLCLLALVCAGWPVAAQDSPGTSGEGAPFLLLPVGARAVSLGRAMTSVEGAEGAFWNPAGLAGIGRSQVVIFRGDQIAGTATALSALFSRPGVGTLGASYLLLDIGDQDFTDASGNFLGTISVRNHLGVISAAATLLDGLSAGVSFKIVQFRLSCRGSQCGDEGTTATTYAFDVGAQAEPIDRLRLGGMIAHVGPSLRVLNAEQADPLPSRFRLSAAYEVVEVLTSREDFSGWLALEVQDRLREPGVPSLYLGTEFTAGDADALSLRAGYVMSDVLDKIQGADPEDGARVGLGIRYDAFDLSIAKSLAVSRLTGETEPVHVTFSIGF
ncbi:MAG TPA: PorV/PorQ family protein [Longimicrobiales bacterium]|nr:PorV/PorQ family protein [Longimicrobiales bacterium]